ncbi:MAG: hypothetical protein NXH75_12465 [Halobacteriovoraceae bacterium]|nr:hypothetical protein [Halobacteriovoraceae bacterium]
MKTTPLFLTILLLTSCAESLDARKVRPGEILGTKGLETEELEKLSQEVNSQAPIYKIPKDGDSLSTRIKYNKLVKAEFDSATTADLKCRFEYSEVINKDTTVVTIVGEDTKYERKREQTPVNPRFINVPNVQTQKETCESEIALLTKTETSEINFSDDRQKFNNFYNQTLLKSLENCKGQAQVDNIRCLSATITRSEYNESPLPTYSIEISHRSVNENLDREPYQLFIELSPRLVHFFPYGVFNLEGKLFASMSDEFKDIESIRFETFNF